MPVVDRLVSLDRVSAHRYAILDGFDLGAGALHLIVARTDSERRQVLNAIGQVWTVTRSG